MLILPTAAFVALFTAWPVVLSIYQSFFRQRMTIARFREPTFIGLGNYVDLFTDPYFIQVIKNTLIYVIGTVPISVMLGFLFSLLVNRKVKGVGIFRLAFFHPMVMPMVSAATIWLFLFTPDYGLFNSALRFLGYSGPENWTGNPNLALLSVMIVAVWKNAGYYMIFYLAGLQNIPENVYEAAALDGANGWQKFQSITRPLLLPLLAPAILIRMIYAFNQFYLFYALNPPYPVATFATVSFYFFGEVGQYAVSAAINIFTIVVLLFMILAFNRWSAASKGVTYA